jgi:lipid-A-disaccharide synthase
MAKKRILYVVAGEESGDARGAEVLAALKERIPELEICGAGGPRIARLATGPFMDWSGEAVVGFWDVVKKYGYFKAQMDRMLAEIEQIGPEAVLFIDYPGFNLRLAKQVKARHPVIKTLYYISPQVWAWNRGRIPKMARFLDRMLCIFPFEKALYEASGLRTEFVGHPMLDSLVKLKSGVRRRDELVGLFPGSRDREVKRLFPVMLEAASLLKCARPGLEFEVAAANTRLAGWIKEHIASKGHDPNLCKVGLDRFYGLAQEAAVGMVCSGTATLESAFFGLPMLVAYKVSWITWVIGRALVKLPHIGMPNVLAGREIVPELLQGSATPERLAAVAGGLLGDSAARLAQQEAFASVIAGLGSCGAAARTADAVACALGE